MSAVRKVYRYLNKKGIFWKRCIRGVWVGNHCKVLVLVQQGGVILKNKSYTFQVVPNCCRIPIIKFQFFILPLSLVAGPQKISELRPLRFFEKENFAAQTTRARCEICKFFGIDLLKIYLISRNVKLFENHKTVLNHSILLYSTVLNNEVLYI